MREREDSFMCVHILMKLESLWMKYNDLVLYTLALSYLRGMSGGDICCIHV